MVNALFVIGTISGILYGILIDGTYFKIFFSLLAIYTVVFGHFLVDRRDVTKRKNMNVTCWNAPTDPSSYLVEDIDVTKALEYVQKLNAEQSEVKITLTHIVTRALAIAAYKIRRDIGRIKWGYFQRSKDIGVVVLVDVEDGRDLVPINLWNAHKDDVITIAKKLSEMAVKSKRNQNREHTEVTKIFNLLPTYLLGLLTSVLTYLSQQCGISISAFKLKGNAYGHIILSNVGTLGIERALAPIVPALHSMIGIAIGKVHQDARAVDGQLMVREVMSFGLTADHRYGDGASIAKFMAAAVGLMTDPEGFDLDSVKDLVPWDELEEQKKHK